MKTCSKCDVSKEESEFPYRNIRTGYLRRECKECFRIKNRQWHRDNKPRKNATARAWCAANPEKAAAHGRRYKYGVTAEQYNAIKDSQHGVCAICQQPDRYRLSVDHCHATEQVRGLLCGNCNRMIGLAKDRPEIMLRAAGYISSFSQQGSVA